ncbi:core protein 22 [Lymphocystis disease virus 4]|uniref:Core protein 22 n=1 Tax=Lymphocystis disease virus 4 TaxID=2704413 RepID=A0A6B9XHM0_9VIRU|nr:core protein 22 [Lymphocystis disease virus 4]QHR78526.1 core protein 22 [Lymphocystis disease virus 4]
MLKIIKTPLADKKDFINADFEPTEDLFLDMIVDKKPFVFDHPKSIVQEEDSEVTIEELKDRIEETTLNYSVTNWKKYLIIFMCVMELMLSRFNVKAAGFAQYQIKNISSYDDLLREMAEKYTLPETKLPVEVRLLLTIAMNIVLFTLGSFVPEKEIILDLLQNL